ncbi:MAG TPA: hypothetical protein VII63_08545 [Caulobacteraceae bacterium]
MAGNLLQTLVFRAADANGAPINGAQLQFYLTGTTTPTNVYTSSSLGTPLSNPVVSDSAGLFPPIYLDPTVTYRMQYWNAIGGLVKDYDPLSSGVIEATQAQVNAGAATGVYVSPAKLAGWTGIATALGYTPLNKAGDTATNLIIANSVLATASAGYLGAPVNEQDGVYAFVAGDAGKLVRHNSGAGHAWTISPFATTPFPVGTAIAVRNVGAGVVTLTRGAGVTQLLSGSGTSKDVAVAQWGLATLIQETQDNWVVSGAGIS